MTEFKINQHTISKNDPPFIIAEAGINHNGDLQKAIEMVKVAKKSGVTAIKFQTFKADEFISDYMVQLRSFLLRQKQAGKLIYPPGNEIFSALDFASVDCCKLVILGQDPYHGAGQAHGLCFSVKPGVAVPPSLMNIYKELKSDTGFLPPNHGCLNYWAEQLSLIHI